MKKILFTTLIFIYIFSAKAEVLNSQAKITLASGSENYMMAIHSNRHIGCGKQIYPRTYSILQNNNIPQLPGLDLNYDDSWLDVSVLLLSFDTIEISNIFTLPPGDQFLVQIELGKIRKSQQCKTKIEETRLYHINAKGKLLVSVFEKGFWELHKDSRIESVVNHIVQDSKYPLEFFGLATDQSLVHFKLGLGHTEVLKRSYYDDLENEMVINSDEKFVSLHKTVLNDRVLSIPGTNYYYQFQAKELKLKNKALETLLVINGPELDFKTRYLVYFGVNDDNSILVAHLQKSDPVYPAPTFPEPRYVGPFFRFYDGQGTINHIANFHRPVDIFNFEYVLQQRNTYQNKDNNSVLYFYTKEVHPRINERNHNMMLGAEVRDVEINSRYRSKSIGKYNGTTERLEHVGYTKSTRNKHLYCGSFAPLAMRGNLRVACQSYDHLHNRFDQNFDFTIPLRPWP